MPGNRDLAVKLMIFIGGLVVLLLTIYDELGHGLGR
jgi:hypothetical protein